MYNEMWGSNSLWGRPHLSTYLYRKEAASPVSSSHAALKGSQAVGLEQAFSETLMNQSPDSIQGSLIHS